MAALALLFALHSFAPSPFFVLDEIDASLDLDNVLRLTRCLQELSHPVPPSSPSATATSSFLPFGGAESSASPPTAQCVIISLKDSCYEHADALIGVYRDRSSKHSGILTFDLSALPDTDWTQQFGVGRGVTDHMTSSDRDRFTVHDEIASAAAVRSTQQEDEAEEKEEREIPPSPPSAAALPASQEESVEYPSAAPSAPLSASQEQQQISPAEEKKEEELVESQEDQIEEPPKKKKKTAKTTTRASSSPPSSTSTAAAPSADMDED